jgi:DNA-binding NarL/FixJ family response regulator
VRVLVATNESVLARGFEAILTNGGLEVVEVCRDVAQLFEGMQRSRPDAAILDMALTPWQNVLVELRQIVPSCQLLVWPRQISKEQAEELIRMGARGVLPGDVTPEVLIDTLRMLSTFPAADPTPASLVKQVCSPAERQILSLVGCGMKNEEIAALVRSDCRTVDTKVRILSQRLGAQDRYELALYGLSIAGETSQPNGDQLWKNEIANAWF